MRRPIQVAPIARSTEGPVTRVWSMIDGRPLWFESPDLPLAAQPEAFGCALMPLASLCKRSLDLADPIDPEWVSHMGPLQDIWTRWWGHGRIEVRGPLAARPVPSRPGGIALCFSGGVDSFYTLLRSGLKIDHLIFVVGYDMRISDRHRAAAAEKACRDVARAVGAKAVLIRTNLRKHPMYAFADWDKTHGGAMAATGHLLAGSVGTLVISSSYPYSCDHPWGSHWTTDPLWSSSGLKVVHWGAERWRAEKLVAIADEDLVRRHLRVCWENRAPVGNCGQCEKCIRTMLILAEAGKLDHFAVFGGEGLLADRIRRLRRVNPVVLNTYEDLKRESLSTDVQAALESLLSRSRRPGRFDATLVGFRRQAKRARRWTRYFIRRLRRKGSSCD